MKATISYDSILYHSILSVNNFNTNRKNRSTDKTAINSVNRYLHILNKEKIYAKSDYFKHLVQACKDLKKGDIITVSITDFTIQNQSLETRTRVNIYSKTYQKNYSY